MAQVKISELTAADPLTGVEEAPFVQGGATKKATVDQIKAYIAAPTVLDDLTDVDTTTVAPTDQQVLVFDAGSGTWVPADQSGGAETFLELTDTPAGYAGSANFAVRVNGAETALEFIDLNTLYAQLGSANVFTGVQTLEAAAPELRLSETDTTDDNWAIKADSSLLKVEEQDDLFATTGTHTTLTHGGGMQVGAPTGGDQGAGTVNATGLFENGEGALIENTSGVVIQNAFTSTGAVVSSTTAIPYDDTIPQITEGAEALSLAFTPKRSDSRLRITTVLQLRSGTLNSVRIAGVFVSSQTGALAVGAQFGDSDNAGIGAASVTAVADVASSSVTSRTFSARFGEDSTDAVYLNSDQNGNRRFGGSYASTLEVTEYMP